MDYLKKGYSMTMIVGVEQPTMQSGILEEGKLVVGPDRPPAVDEAVRDGDGTVPGISATPIELGNNPPVGYFVEIHGSLQKNEYVLDELRAHLQQLQVDPDRPPVRGATWFKPPVSF